MKDLKNVYKNKSAEKKEVIEALQKELEDAKKNVEEKYKKKLNQLNEEQIRIKAQIDFHNNNTCFFSTFNLKNISRIIIELINQVELDEFIYVTRKIYVFNENKVYNVQMIVKNGLNISHFNNQDEFQNFLDNNKVLVLTKEENFISQKMEFFKINGLEVQSTVDYTSFPYVQKFINGIIIYRKNKKYINENLLDYKNIIHSFLIQNPALVVKTTIKTIKESVESINEQLTSETDIPNYEIINDSINDLLLEKTKNDHDFNTLEILFEGENIEASINYESTFANFENACITKANLTCSGEIWNNYTNSYEEIKVKDTILVGVVDLIEIKDLKFLEDNLKSKYLVKLIDNRYLKILFLPNKTNYSFDLNHNIIEPDCYDFTKNLDYYKESIELLNYIKHIIFLKSLDNQKIR